MSISTRAISTAGIISLAALALTGCAAGGQSKAEACEILKTEVTAVGNQMQSALSSLNSDPTAELKVLTDAEGTLKAMDSKISNGEISPTVSNAVGAFSGYTGMLSDMLEDPANADMEKFQTDTKTFQTAWQALGTVCSG